MILSDTVNRVIVFSNLSHRRTPFVGLPLNKSAVTSIDLLTIHWQWKAHTARERSRQQGRGIIKRQKK